MACRAVRAVDQGVGLRVDQQQDLPARMRHIGHPRHQLQVVVPGGAGGQPAPETEPRRDQQRAGVGDEAHADRVPRRRAQRGGGLVPAAEHGDGGAGAAGLVGALEVVGLDPAAEEQRRVDRHRRALQPEAVFGARGVDAHAAPAGVRDGGVPGAEGAAVGGLEGPPRGAAAWGGTAALETGVGEQVRGGSAQGRRQRRSRQAQREERRGDPPQGGKGVGVRCAHDRLLCGGGFKQYGKNIPRAA